MTRSASALATANLVKAYLSILPSGGGGGRGTPLTFKFNPNQYQVSRSSNWTTTTVPSTAAAQSESRGPEPRSLSMEIFLDETDSMSGDVSRDVERLMNACGPHREGVAANQSVIPPPVVRFGWGSHVGFEAYLRSVNATYSLFRPDGTPVRATCQVTLMEKANEASREAPRPPQNPTSGTPAIHRTRTVVAGDTLASIAFGEYRDTRGWRALADANGIQDPTRIRCGTRLLVPPPEEAVPQS